MIVHVLRDGTVLDNIEGHIVKVQDAETLYNMIDQITDTRRTNTKEVEK